MQNVRFLKILDMYLNMLKIRFAFDVRQSLEASLDLLGTPDNKYLTMFEFLYLLPFYRPRFSLLICVFVVL